MPSQSWISIVKRIWFIPLATGGLVAKASLYGGPQRESTIPESIHYSLLVLCNRHLHAPDGHCNVKCITAYKYGSPTLSNSHMHFLLFFVQCSCSIKISECVYTHTLACPHFNSVIASTFIASQLPQVSFFSQEPSLTWKLSRQYCHIQLDEQTNVQDHQRQVL